LGLPDVFAEEQPNAFDHTAMPEVETVTITSVQLQSIQSRVEKLTRMVEQLSKSLDHFLVYNPRIEVIFNTSDTPVQQETGIRGCGIIAELRLIGAGSKTSEPVDNDGGPQLGDTQNAGHLFQGPSTSRFVSRYFWASMCKEVSFT
jgi:hypothetical protein